MIFAFCLKTKQISSHTNIHTHYDRLNGMNGRVGLTKDIFSNLIFAHCQHLPRNVFSLNVSYNLTIN